MAGERRIVAAALILAIAFTAGGVFGQDADPGVAKKPPKLSTLWRDMLSYINIAQADAARSTAEAIIARNPKPAELYMLSLKTPKSMTVLSRGMHLQDMKGVIDSLIKLIEKGYQAERADPERIKKSIEMLDKGLQSYAVAHERIKFHGELAMPQLVQKLMNPGTPNSLRTLIITVLPIIGKDAVRPLSVALQTGDAKLQEIFANALGQIEYPHAAAGLKELIERKDTLERTRKIARIALLACGGRGAADMSIASLFYKQAEKYYYRAESLLPDPRSRTANVWFWREGVGLVYVPVPRDILCDIYAMRMAKLALEHDPKFHPAVSLWISANLNKEANLPAGQVDPLKAPDQPSAKFYALAGGPRYLQPVVERAMDDFNTPVALGAISALVHTAGPRNLLQHTKGGARPLVEAMSYPDREVRFFAAVSLANAMPEQRFEGQELVIGVLNSALRQQGRKVAMLIAVDLKQRNTLKDLLRKAGYLVVEGRDVVTALAAANRVSGVDVAVVGSKPRALAVIAAVRSRPVYSHLPFVVAHKSSELRSRAKADKRVILVGPEPKAGELNHAVAEAVKLGVGRPFSPEEAAIWSVTAADTIRMLGQAGNTIYDITRAQKSLIESLKDSREPVQVAASKALAVMDTAKAQRALANQAVDADAKTTIRLAAFDALNESVRKFDNRLAERHIKAILAIVTGEDSRPLRDAAAQVLGTLNLPSQDIIPLITESAEKK